MKDKIEILGVDIFQSHRKETEFVERIRECLNKQIGWHYFLDLAWIMKEINFFKPGSLVLDAGGGNGLAQFIMSEQGYNVINADFSNPVHSDKVKDRYGKIMSRLNNPAKKVFNNRYTRHLKSTHSIPIELNEEGNEELHLLTKEEFVSYINQAKNMRQDCPSPAMKGALPYALKYDVAKNNGRIFLYKCDLKDMSLIPDNALDGVVSISALEHNDHDDFQKCIDELLRIVKPGGKLIITVSASQKEDWFHEASKGWCYSEGTLKKMFQLSENVQSNYLKKDELFEQLSEEGNGLHKRLAAFHYKSGANGMPWGVWKPQYMPVGIVKTKNGKEDSKENPHVSGKGETLQIDYAFNLNREGEELFAKGDIKEALHVFKRVTEIDPGYATAYNNLGVVHLHEGDVQEASECFAKALNLDPDDRVVVINCGRLLTNSDSFGDAKKIYSSYLERHPEDEEVSELISEL